MKWLQCEHCKEGAYGGASTRFPDGEPMVVGRVSYFPYRFKCSKCRKLNVLTPAQWNLLPMISEEEARELGVL